MRKAAPLFVLLLCSSFVSAQSRAASGELERKVDKIFAVYDKPDSPGCAVGVIRDGAFVYKRGYGQASLELGVPLTPQSTFYMASMSKQFTAASAILAAEQGYFSLDDDVHKYIPELPPYGQTITLRQMLHHTSGLRDMWELLILSGRKMEDVHPATELVDMITRQKALNFKPGDEFLYSNSNYLLVAEIIRRTTGKPFSRFADENIFKPLGMTHTAFYDDRTIVFPGRVPAYTRKGAGFSVNWSNNFEAVGAGGLMSSVDDLLLWDRNFYDNKLGKGTMLRELQTHGVLNDGKKIGYALGLIIGNYRGLPRVEHSGGTFGYATDMQRFPEQHFSVVCLCNVNTSPAMLVQRVVDVYLEGQFSQPAPEAKAVAEIPPPAALHMDVQPFAGAYQEAGSHDVVDVTAQDGELELFKTRFKAGSPSRFSGPQGQSLTFEKMAADAIRMTLATPGMAPRIYQRVQRVKPTAAELAHYTGEYASDELQVNWKIAVSDGRLTIIKATSAPDVLEPTIRDEFRMSRGPLIFRRDAKGRITGFEISAGRVRNVAFVRK